MKPKLTKLEKFVGKAAKVLDQAGQPRVRWGSVKPKAPGFYWWRYNKDTGAYVVMVYAVRRGLKFLHPYDRTHERVTRKPAQWAGPIELPLDPFNK